MAAEESNQVSRFFNVGGCFFSIPLSRLYLFRDSLLFKNSLSVDQNARLFIDRDGCTFRHVHYYIQTGKLSSSCNSELKILYEQAAGLHLTSLQQALENLLSGKHFLRARTLDPHATERPSINYRKTRICINTKLQESVTSPVSTAHDAIPLGLIGTPLVDSHEEVHYCFMPLELTRKHPGLVTRDNLLWLCEDLAVIECGSLLFRFIANFLHSGKILLPEQFRDYETLKCESDVVGITEFIQTLEALRGPDGMNISTISTPSPEEEIESPAQPLYALTFDLLVKYPDSSLGQLYVDSNLEGSKLCITGTGVIFQHVENWLGTCRLPLTERASQLYELCEYLDRKDGVYLAIKEALWEFFHRVKTTGGAFTAGPTSASVSTFTAHKVIRVYVGTHWYATYLRTLLKHPELLYNSIKTRWIAHGQSLHVNGDGQMFRHILNFLRCGRLMVPAEFREWPLLCLEIEEFQIPALSEALEDCSDYKAWCSHLESASKRSSSSSAESTLIYDDDEGCYVGTSFDKGHFLGELKLCARRLESDSPEEPAVTVRKKASCSRVDSRDLPNTSAACFHTRGTQGNQPPQELTKGGTRELSGPLEKLELLVEDLVQWDRSLVSRATLLGAPGRELTASHPTGWPDLFKQPYTLLPTLTDLQLKQDSYKRAGVPTEQQETRGLVELKQRCKDQANTYVLKGDEDRRPSLPERDAVLRVEHPPVLGKGEKGGYFTVSVIYTDIPPYPDHHQHAMQTPRRDQENVFVYFNQTYKEIVYARECHAFLTGIILDSKRLRDSKNCAQQIRNLVYFLWNRQVEPEEFVAKLMKISCFEQQKHSMGPLLQWVKYTLPLAKQYNECIQLLRQKQNCTANSLLPEERNMS